MYNCFVSPTQFSADSSDGALASTRGDEVIHYRRGAAPDRPVARNVREPRSCVERTEDSAGQATISVVDLPERV